MRLQLIKAPSGKYKEKYEEKYKAPRLLFSLGIADLLHRVLVSVALLFLALLYAALVHAVTRAVATKLTLLGS